MDRVRALALAVCLALEVVPADANCGSHSEESTAGLCGSSRGPDWTREPLSVCAPGAEAACAGVLQRARDAATVIVRYRALGRDSGDGCFARR